MNLTDQERVDFVHLMTITSFRNLMLRVIQMAGIFQATANGTDKRTSFDDGRRSLGLDILRLLEAAQPVQGSSGNPTLTLIQLLREEAQSPLPERTQRGRRSDPYSELTPDGPAGDTAE